MNSINSIKPHSVHKSKPLTVRDFVYPIYMGIKDILAANLRAELKARSWSQQEYQRRTGLPQSSLAAIIRTERAADIETLENIAVKLGRETWQLLVPNTVTLKVSAPSIGETPVSNDVILAQIVNWYKELPADSQISMYVTAQKLFKSRRATVPSPHIRGATKIDHKGHTHVDNKNKRASDKKHG